MIKSHNIIDVVIGETFVTPASGAVSLPGVTSGQLGVIDSDGNGLPSNLSKFFRFYQGDSNNVARLSLPIKPSAVVRVNKKAYQAAVAQVSTMTIASADVANNTIYSVFVVDGADQENINKPRKEYTYLSSASDTATGIAAGIVAAVVADTNAFVTASNAAGVITFTGIARDKFSLPYQTVFTVAPAYGFSSNTTVVLTTGASKGQGTYDVVSTLEEIYKGYKGNMNRSEYVVLPTYYAQASVTYVTYIIEHGQPQDSIQSDTISNKIVHTYLFIDSTATASITALDTFFKTTIAGLPVEY